VVGEGGHARAALVEDWAVPGGPGGSQCDLGCAHSCWLGRESGSAPWLTPAVPAVLRGCQQGLQGRFEAMSDNTEQQAPDVKPCVTGCGFFG
jgi:hypothetical protein